MNKLLIEQPYVMQLSLFVKKFQWFPNQRLARFRCPICGDSQKNESKTRGFVYVNKTTKDCFSYKCHNCGYNHYFERFLKDFFPNLHTQLKADLMKEYIENKRNFEKLLEKDTVVEEHKFEINDNIKWQTVDTLYDDHPAKQYCLGRKIPKHKLSRILYVKNFKHYIEEVCPLKYERMPEAERIVFELRDKNKKLVGIQARIIEEKTKKNRFLTLKFDDSQSKIYGLDHVNIDRPVIVTEGIIDSLFLDNCIALTGGDVVSNLDAILGVPKSNIFIALDNEPRSTDTIHRIEKAIEYGYNVFFWGIDSCYKDINDMVRKGNISETYIQNEILTKSLTGFKAKVKFNSWKKV